MTADDTGKLRQDPAETRMALGMDLLLKVQGVKGDYKTRLVGLVPFDCIIMSMPRIPGFAGTVRHDTPIQVRYMAEGTVYGFSTRIIGHVAKPVPLLFAAYPQRLERYELRKATRLNCFMPATLHTRRGQHKAYVVDLSEGGCRANTPAGAHAPQTESGEQVILEMPLCGSAEMVVARAEVRNLQQQGEALSLGLAFAPLEPCASQRLLDFLEEGRLYS